MDTFLIIHKPVKGKKEMHTHMYMTCTAMKDIRERRDKEVLQILTKQVCTPMISVTDLPLWVSTGTNIKAKGQSEATQRGKVDGRGMTS